MVAYPMALGGSALGQDAMAAIGEAGTENEEARPDFAAREHVEHAPGDFRIRAVVERKRYVTHHLFVCSVEFQPVAVSAGSAITRFSSAPIFSISIRTTSPTTSHRGGFITAATPPGVPVDTMVPGRRVKTVERVSIWEKQSKMRFLVFECCRISPLTKVLRSRA